MQSPHVPPPIFNKERYVLYNIFESIPTKPFEVVLTATDPAGKCFKEVLTVNPDFRFSESQNVTIPTICAYALIG